MDTPRCKNCYKEVEEWIKASKTKKKINNKYVLECPHCEHYNEIEVGFPSGQFNWHITKAFPKE
jgi:DNA-directed RNA polymerase subunit RPC12/RpoP